ncbi:MAG: branched-chain amino acid transporter ATP-binding protein/permease [Blastococcus sp.]|nr:branched-chain amino acid transporter ATP-binding protein/permease [Blastococcus sp.]
MSYYLNNLLALLAIFSILGMSFNLIMGYAGQFSIAHGAFFGQGAYTTGVLMRDYEWSFLPAMVASFLFAGLVSVILGVAARRVTDVYLVILTLAWQVAAVELYSNLDITGGSGGLIGIPRADIFGYELAGPTQVIILAWAVCIVVALAVRYIVRSPFGRTLRGLREDEIAARSLGKPTANLKIKAFVISSALAGVAGSLFAVQIRFISPAEFALDRSIEVLSLAIIGGLATLIGPFVGAAVIVLIPELLGYLDLPNTLVGAVNAFLFSGMVLVFLRFRPQGLVGRRPVRNAANSHLGDVIPGPPQPLGETLEDGATAHERAPEPAGAAGLPVAASREVRTLSCEGASISFGGLTAVDDVTLTLRPGAITGLVGPNGAGKTTLFNILSGLLTPDTGAVRFGSADITGKSLDARARDGIVRSFQEMRLFDGMSAQDNILLAMTPKADEQILPAQRGGLHRRRAERERQERTAELLAYLGLGHQAQTLAGDLSYAEQKLLMMGRLLATDADCYLLDEPMSGLDAAGRERIMRLLQDTVARGATICLVEHSLDVIRSVCSWVAFLADGKLVKQGPTEEITNDRELAAMYFGN